jgi:hypothetical protein
MTISTRLEDVDRSIEGSSVLAESLFPIEGEHGDRPCLLIHYLAADDRSLLVVGQVGQSRGLCLERISTV